MVAIINITFDENTKSILSFNFLQTCKLLSFRVLVGRNEIRMVDCSQERQLKYLLHIACALYVRITEYIHTWNFHLLRGPCYPGSANFHGTWWTIRSTSNSSWPPFISRPPVGFPTSEVDKLRFLSHSITYSEMLLFRILSFAAWSLWLIPCVTLTRSWTTAWRLTRYAAASTLLFDWSSSCFNNNARLSTL